MTDMRAHMHVLVDCCWLFIIIEITISGGSCIILVVRKLAACIADKMGVSTPRSSKQCSVTMMLKVLLVVSCSNI